MKVAVFSTKRYDREFLERVNASRHELRFLEPALRRETAPLAAGALVVCAFVNDHFNREVIEALAALGVRLIALRCAGYNNVDLAAAAEKGLTVVRVPGYSPHAVAEHTVGLILTLNRRLHRAHNRVREGNFSLDGLLGFDLLGKTAGIIGTGRIGTVVAKILRGFGCAVLAFDPHPNEACRALGAEYCGLPQLLGRAEIVTLHCPLSSENRHLIDARAIEQMRNGVMLINTRWDPLESTCRHASLSIL